MLPIWHMACSLSVSTNSRTAREEILGDFVYFISLGVIPLMAVIICFVVTRIWGD